MTRRLRCIRCHYDLHGVSTQSDCPECALPVAESLHACRLEFAQTAWLRRVRRGLWTVLTSLSGIILLTIVCILVALSVSAPGPDLDATMTAICACVLTASWLLGGIGVFGLTALDATGRRFRILLWYRKLARIALFVTPFGLLPGVSFAMLWMRGLARRAGRHGLWTGTTLAAQVLLAGYTAAIIGIGSEVWVAVLLIPGFCGSFVVLLRYVSVMNEALEAKTEQGS